MTITISMERTLRASRRCVARTVCSGLLLACCWGLPGPVSGQISIIPLIQEVSVNRGGQAQFQLQVANRGSDTLSLVMQAYNLEISEDGLPLPVREETQRSCKDWITFTPGTFTLEPGQAQTVEGLVRAPTDVEGGYYAFVTCEFSVPSEPILFGENQKSEAQIQLGRAVSSTLMVTVRSSKNQVQLEPDSLVLSSGQGLSSGETPFSSVDGGNNKWQAILPVVNTGNVHTKAEGEVSIWSENARLVEKTQLVAGRGYVLPGKRRVFKAQGAKALNDGIYLVKVQIRTREGQLVQGSFPYSITKGKAIPGAASEAVRALVEASAPKFSLSPRQLDYQITPDGVRTKGIRITNHTSDTLLVSHRTVSWTLSDSGRVVLNPDAARQTRPCASWITVSPDTARIAPKGSGTAKVTVSAPPELEGEYYGGIVFETARGVYNLPTELELARTSLITVSSSKNLVYKAEIKSFDYKAVSRMMRTFLVNVRNDGNVHCFASGKLEVYDAQWKLAMEPIAFGGPNDYILPERVRGYLVPCPGNLKPGRYEAVVAVTYSEGAPPLVSRMNFYAD